MSDRDLSEEEKRAWRAVTQNVQPLAGRRAAPERRRIAPSVPAPVTATKRTQTSAPENSANDKKVRRGQQTISGRLDLHGFTQDAAWSALPTFLRTQQAQGSKCVIVITGKGAGGRGVLRENFLRWLEMPEAAGLVSGYAQAHPRHGGGGAWYVYLRRR